VALYIGAITVVPSVLSNRSFHPGLGELAVALSDDLASVTKYMLSLAEDPERLATFQADPSAAIEAAELSPGAKTFLAPTGRVDNAVVIIIVVVVVTVINPVNSGGNRSLPQ
jgi:hypothetical protein